MIEYYCVEAKNIKEARKLAPSSIDPYYVRLLKETVKEDKRNG